MKHNCLHLIVLTILAVPCLVTTARAQDLVNLLQERRLRAVAEHIISSEGYLKVRAPEPLPVRYSPVWKRGEQEPAVEKSFQIFNVQRIPKLARNWFDTRFKDTQWIFQGSNGLGTIDTTFSWRIRGMLEAEYGSPTQTVSDFGFWRDLQPGQYIQFEYWFVINNNIPFRLIDVNGPFERGVVVSSDANYAEDILAIRNALLEPLVKAMRMQPYVDYYYDAEFDAWYRTGYDGSELFIREIRTSEIGNARPAKVDE